MDEKISEDEQNKTGCLVRVRRLRGYVHDLERLDINKNFTFFQRDLCLAGFFDYADDLLDEIEFLIQECLEDCGTAKESIECLQADITALEEELNRVKK